MSTPLTKLDLLAYIVKFFGNEQGRDKVNKIVQYGSRLLAAELLAEDPKSDLGRRFKGLFQHTRDARKLVRWFKQFAELQKIQVLLKQPASTKQQLQITGALGLFTYWTFDNLVYLANAGTVGKNSEWAKLSMFGWNVGITTALIVDGLALQDNLTKEQKLRDDIGSLSKPAAEPNSQLASNETRARLEKELAALLSQRQVLTLNILKNVGDWLISANGWELPQKLGIAPFSERVVSIGGLVSGSIVCYQVWKSL